MKPVKLFQPRHFDAFHCIGADCEDTCCVGWHVRVDKSTYEKYQECSDPELGSLLHKLITINDNSSDDGYARIALNGAACSFLSDGLCSIQQRLGEEYLSITCATFPRIINRVDEVLQRALGLACPEAARLVLLDPKPMEFDEREYEDGSIRLGNSPSVDTSSLTNSPEPYRFFPDVQRLVTALLQNRSYPIQDRLLMLGCLCEDLDGRPNRISGDLPAARPANPTAQLEIVLELIVARIGSDYNPRSFLDCYKEFMDGIQWTAASAMDEIGFRYAEAHAQHYVSFMATHEYILEHYLVNYAHTSLFPVGLPESSGRLHDDRVPSRIATQYMLMIAYFAIIRTLLIGMAGFHKAAFGAGQVVKLIQSFTKTVQHSSTYPGLVIRMLADQGMTTPASLDVLIRN